MTPIEHFLKEKNITAWKVEKLANLSKGLIGKAIKTNAVLSLETIEKISLVFPDVNKSFLKTGVGEVLNTYKKTKKSDFETFINAIPYIFKDYLFPDLKRERIKLIIRKLSSIYQLEEVYKRLGYKGNEGSQVFIGMKSPELFIEALQEKFDVNPEFIESGIEPMFLDREVESKKVISVLNERLIEKDEIIKALKETISTQKELIANLKKR